MVTALNIVRAEFADEDGNVLPVFWGVLACYPYPGDSNPPNSPQCPDKALTGHQSPHGENLSHAASRDLWNEDAEDGEYWARQARKNVLTCGKWQPEGKCHKRKSA